MHLGHIVVFLFVFLVLPLVSLRLMNRIGFFGVIATVVITVAASRITSVLFG